MLSEETPYITDRIFFLLSEYNIATLIVTGPPMRCYLYPPNVNPEIGRDRWIGYGESETTIFEAVMKALTTGATSRRVDNKELPLTEIIRRMQAPPSLLATAAMVMTNPL